MRNNRILFYSSVSDKKLFEITGFYKFDILALKNVGYKVEYTNNISSFLKFWNYDISFLYFYKKSFIACIISFIFKKRIIFTGGIDELSDFSELSKTKKGIFKITFLVCYLLSNFCNIVSLTDLDNIRLLLKKFGIKRPRKLKYFPHSIDVNLDNSNFIKENIFTTICWMGAVQNVKRKGVDKSIHVFHEFLKNNNDFKLFIIGSPGIGQVYLQKIVDNLKINNKVIFTGAINEYDKIQILQKSKYYFQLSTYEGFGLAVIEAMLYENIIIHSGKGGMKDTIADLGYLVENTESFYTIAQKINCINKKYESYLSEIQLNKELVKSKFSLKTRAENLKSIISYD